MTISSFVGEALIGWLAADLFSGTFHWWMDRCALVSWPFIGPYLIGPNRAHHITPLSFLDNGFAYRSGATILAALAVAALWFWLFGLSVGLVFAAIGMAISTEVHMWTHAPRLAPRLVRVLQETGVVQSPKHHAGHHRPPSDRHYCSLTNWLNPILDALRLWERLERALLRTGLNLSLGEA